MKGLKSGRIALLFFVLVVGYGACEDARAQTPVGLVPPPKAHQLAGSAEEIVLGPIYKQRHVCTEHTAVSWDLGDSLATDCLVVSNWGDGYPRLYRTDGKKNEDWYGWHVEVMAPVSGTVVGTFVNNVENTPGVFGKGQASAVQIETPARQIVILVHITDIRVKIGDRVRAGQVIAQVGNSGIADAPHVHVGAYNLKNSLPLQIRWDLAQQRQVSGEH